MVVALLIMPFNAIFAKLYGRDPDIWWHIRVGDWIVQHHAIPRVAIFSQYSDRPWVPYSWCFELLVSGVHATLGLPGIPKLLMCIQLLISLVFLLAVCRVSCTFWRSWPIAVAGIIAADVNPLRPMAFTVLFFLVELLLIFEAERSGEDRLLFWLGPLFILWANIHVQFFYGIAVVALYVACRIFRIVWHRGQDRAGTDRTACLKLAAIFAAAVLGSCVGPNGWLPYKVVVEYATQTFVYRVISEMLAMDFRSPVHYVELLLVMAACFLAGRLRPSDLFRPLLLAMTAIVSFRSLRDMWFAAIAASFVIAEAIRPKTDKQEVTDRTRPAWRFEPAMSVMAVAVAGVISFGYGVRHGMNATEMINDIGNVYPVEATEFVRDHHLPGPLYNSFNWGGFLIFNLRDQPVSIDPRTNIYGDKLLARSIATTGGMNWQADPVFARSNLVILEKSVPLASALARDPNYSLVYQDPIAVVFVKKQSQLSSN